MRRKYHLIGAAGAGMNPLAQLLLADGHHVSGSDRFHDQGAAAPALDLLQRQGLQLHPQDGSGVAAGLDAVVASSAVEDDNPDIAAARRQNIPVLRRAELLAALAAPHTVIGIAGTAGKTTVTGMTGWTLERLGADPTVVNGGALLDWRGPDRIGNFRRGRSDYWVLELDESDRSLLRFNPAWAVITNVSKDHFELAEVQALFDRFAGQVRGEVIGRAPAPPDFQPAPTAGGVRFQIDGVEFQLQTPGRHNAANARLCALLCARLGYSLPAISAALAEFRGIERRLEYIGRAGAVDIYDDYAHNPAKITAAWETMACNHPRVVAVWRPHGYGPLRLMWAELLATFKELAGTAGAPLFLLPVFFTGGTADRRIGSGELAAALQGAGVNARAVADYAELRAALRPALRPGDALLFMGARDPELPRFARDFLAEFRGFRAPRAAGAG